MDYNSKITSSGFIIGMTIFIDSNMPMAAGGILGSNKITIEEQKSFAAGMILGILTGHVITGTSHLQIAGIITRVAAGASLEMVYSVARKLAFDYMNQNTHSKAAE